MPLPLSAFQPIKASAPQVCGNSAKTQLLGTDAAKSSLILGCWSTTDTVRAELGFVKSGNAAVGSSTIVANGESLGGIVWYGDDGVDFVNQAVSIEGLCVAAPGSNDMAGGIQINCSPDSSATVAEVARFTSAVGLQLGVAGTKLGNLNICGNTSGVVSLTVGAAAGTWTMTLPAAAGSNGEQLTTNGSGVCTWAAAGSISAVKNLIAEVSDRAAEVLAKLVGTPVYEFRYKADADGYTTGDTATVYTGIVAEDLPEVMHHDAKIFSPVSAFGELLLALKALNAKVDRLESATTAA